MYKVNTIIFSAALVSIMLSTAVQSAEPMSESDLGNVSAVSGNVLNIMGSSASGDTTNKPAPQKQASISANYIEVDQALESRNNTSLTPSAINPQDSVSTFKISERTNGQNNTATLYYDEKANLNSSSYNDNVLSINQDVQIQRVQIEQAGHSASPPFRGDYTFGNLQVNGAVSIMGR